LIKVEFIYLAVLQVDRTFEPVPRDVNEKAVGPQRKDDTLNNAARVISGLVLKFKIGFRYCGILSFRHGRLKTCRGPIIDINEVFICAKHFLLRHKLKKKKIREAPWSSGER